MAYLLSLIVNGVTRLQNDTHGTNIYADKHIKNNSNDNYILLGGGGHIDKGTFALANHGVHWEGFTKRATASATWGTLISASGYTPLFWLDSTTGGGVAFSDKGGQTFMQIDGYFYQNEGRYLVLDTNNYSSYLDGRYYTETEADTRFVNVSGDTMTGTLTMNAGTGIQMKYTSKGNDPWMYANGAPNYGIRYFEGDPDKMTLSASGNNDNTSKADLCINGNGEGTVTIRGNIIWHAGNDGSGSGLAADTVDGYHASSLWRSDGGVWNPSSNITLGASANGQEWSFDITRNGYTGCYWHVWDSQLGTILRVNADDGKVSAQYGFVGNLTGNASSASTVTVNNSDTNTTYRMVFHSGTTLYSTAGIYCNANTDSVYASFMELSRTTDHGLKVGSIRGTAVGSRTGQYIHMYERVHIGSPNGWGSNDAPSYGLSTYGGAWFAVSTGSVGIGNTNPSYKLHVSGDSYTTGWARADSGFYVENKGVHYMAGSASGIGQIYLTNNEFNWGASNANLYFNHRAAANGTTVTNYIWNAGTSSSYATHRLGSIHIHSNGSSYNESIRIHPSSAGWHAIVLCGTDNTGDSGVSTNTWGIYANSGTMYINKGTSNGAGNPRAMGTSTGWTFGNTDLNSYALNAASFICASWVRTKGATGWYNEDYGGGWYMNDSTWIRNYNSKQTYLSVSTYPSLVCNAQSGNDTNIRFDLAGSAKGYIGYLKSYGTFLYNCASTKRVYVADDGYFYTQSYINVGAGNEKNASNPPYVWGVNGSDNFMRTYATSSLSVNYATSAGSAGYSGYTLSLDNVGLPSSTSNGANTVWCKFATITFNVSAWCNTAGYLFFSGGESSDYKGILEYHFRAGQTASDLGVAELSWITKSHDYATVIAVKTANNVYDFYTNNCSTWSTPRIYHFSAYSDRFKWNVGSWSTTKPTAAYTASDTGRVYYATNARYVIADNNAASPGYSLLQSGSGRADASPSGDTWIYWDTLGGTSSPWGFMHQQYDNLISFYGAGKRISYIDLANGFITAETYNSWLSPSRTQLGRKDTTTYTDRSCVGTTDGNLHIDPYKNKDLYLNYYCPGEGSSQGRIYLNGGTYYIKGGYYNGTAQYANSASAATTCTYPAGFTSRGTSDWSGVTGTLATDWSVNGADIMFKYDGSKLNVITDGRFYQGIDIYGASKRVLDEYDISNTTWGTATYATTVAVNNSNSNSTYRMVWHNGSTLYSTSSIYCNPSTDALYATRYYANGSAGPHFTGTSTAGNWAYLRLDNSSVLWDIATNSSTTSVGANALDIREKGADYAGIAIRYNTSSYGRLVVMNNTNTETSIGYLNTKFSSSVPIWTAGAGIGNTTSFGWWYYNVGCKMYLTTDGYVYASAYFESSDQRLKNFHNSIDANLDKLKSIPKKYFSWKKDNENKLHIGTSAQAIRELYPELVSESEDGMLSVDYAKLSIVALKAIDVLHDEIKLLKSTNSRLEKRIQELEK